MIVGLAAGGATDVMARLIAQRMSESLRTTRATWRTARAAFHPGAARPHCRAADGHTLFFISTSTLITQPLHPDYPFDLLR